MAQRRYYIRSGAKTTAGGTVRASSDWFILNGTAVAYEGDPVDCPACGTQGVIKYVMPRLPDSVDGKEVALSDDLCICNCNPSPKLIADQETDFQVITAEMEESARGDGRAAGASASPSIYDERPQLAEAPAEGLPYFIETPDGRTFSGRAGSGGLLPRIETDGEKEYILLWGDEALARMMEHDHA